VLIIWLWLVVQVVDITLAVAVQGVIVLVQG
jgi:hypothetical protein